MYLDDIDIANPNVYLRGVAHDRFALLHRETPVFRHREANGPGFWALTRHEDIVRVACNPARSDRRRRFSSAMPREIRNTAARRSPRATSFSKRMIGSFAAIKKIVPVWLHGSLGQSRRLWQRSVSLWPSCANDRNFIVPEKSGTKEKKGRNDWVGSVLRLPFGSSV
jgi:hypothetical protein